VVLRVKKGDLRGLKPAVWRALAARLKPVSFPKPVLETSFY